jgi:hypothetical protein
MSYKRPNCTDYCLKCQTDIRKEYLGELPEVSLPKKKVNLSLVAQWLSYKGLSGAFEDEEDN